MKVVSIVGMPGAGKSAVARVFEENGFIRVRFGDITDEEIARRGLELNEKNERYIRELLRKEHGMTAYAKLNLPRLDASLDRSNVVADGLYSWEEYLFLKERYGDKFCLVAVWASPKTRYERLKNRNNRHLSEEEAAGRDKSEIENLNKGGPIAMADYTILNESTLDNLRKEAKRILKKLSEN